MVILIAIEAFEKIVAYLEARRQRKEITMDKYFVVMAEGYGYALESCETEDEAKEASKKYARKMNCRIFILYPIGYAEPIDPPVRYRSLHKKH